MSYCNACETELPESCMAVVDTHMTDDSQPDDEIKRHLSPQASNLQQQIDSLQQQNTSLQQQLTASQQDRNNIQQQLNTLQGQLKSAQSELDSYKKQLAEMREKYDKLSSASGIDKLRGLFKQLTSSQMDTLHAHTNFRVDNFEKAHSDEQLQCSTLFIQSKLKQLKSSVDAVIQIQKNTLAQRKHGIQNVLQALATAGVSRAIIDASTKPLETEIGQIETGIGQWNTFLTVLTGVANQVLPISAQEEVDEAKDNAYAEEKSEC